MKKFFLISALILLMPFVVLGTVDFKINKNRPANTESAEDTAPQNFDITMTFSGDVLIAENLDGHRFGGFNSYAESQAPDYFLKNAAKYFLSDDFTVVNLENVLSDNALSPAAKSGTAFWFKSKTSNTDILSSAGVECVSIANNHTRDYGVSGFNDTAAALNNAGIEYGTEDKTVYFEKNGFKIAVICCCMWNNGAVSRIINRINDASALSDYQVIFFHGGKEGTHEVDAQKISACHALTDGGADLIIGSHPHVLQKTEKYNNVNIVYSLGNFCFGGNLSPENRTALYRVRLTISPDNALVSEETDIIPFYVYTGPSNNYQPSEIEDAAQAQAIIDYMNGLRSLPY